MAAPKAFISHASEDKDRFVLPFATMLRQCGIDAWVDKWEIRPGDSLVHKIFNEGIGKANAAIVIISAISVRKPWIREEFDSAFVAKVERQIRLIPVVIEPCEIPIPLRHLVQVRVRNISDFKSEADEIARTLFDISIAPALGNRPDYADPAKTLKIRGLDASDVRVLFAIGDLRLGGESDWIGRDTLEEQTNKIGLSRSVVDDSLEMLETENFLEAMHGIGNPFGIFRLTARGLGTVIQSRFPDFSRLTHQIAAYVVNTTQCEVREIHTATGIPLVVIQHVVKELAARNLVSIVEGLDATLVYEVSVQLKRAVAGNKI